MASGEWGVLRWRACRVPTSARLPGESFILSWLSSCSPTAGHPAVSGDVKMCISPGPLCWLKPENCVCKSFLWHKTLIPDLDSFRSSQSICRLFFCKQMPVIYPLISHPLRSLTRNLCSVDATLNFFCPRPTPPRLIACKCVRERGSGREKERERREREREGHSNRVYQSQPEYSNSLGLDIKA